MPKPKHHEFKIRISPDLMAIIDEARGERSKNSQINAWLWSKASGDHADRIADGLRPVLASLSEADRIVFVERLVSALEILARTGKR